MRRHISQREAHRLAKRVDELETLECERHRTWSSDFPGGVRLITWTIAPDESYGILLSRVQELKHPLVARYDGQKLRIYALKAPA